jgi:hypothetical protein
MSVENAIKRLRRLNLKLAAEAGLGAARGSAACHECKRDTSGEMTWPGESGHEICQECWEAECSRSWWVMVNALGAAGLLEPPNRAICETRAQK